MTSTSRCCQQYLIYLGKVAHGDLGPSYKNKDFTVVQLIATGLPVSARLGLCAMALALLLGTPWGRCAALKQNRWQDYSVMTVAMLGITIPTFVTAPILTLLLGIYCRPWPAGGRLERRRAGQHDPAGDGAGLAADRHRRPADARLMVEVLRANYIRTARAKGLPAHRIVLGHALRAAALPLVSYLGPALAAILTGSLVVEEIFGLPGIGRYFVQGALNRDYTLVLGVVICYAALIIAAEFPGRHRSTAFSIRGCGLHDRNRLRLPQMPKTMARRRHQKGRSLWVDARRRLLQQPRRLGQHGHPGA